MSFVTLTAILFLLGCGIVEFKQSTDNNVKQKTSSTDTKHDALPEPYEADGYEYYRFKVPNTMVQVSYATKNPKRTGDETVQIYISDPEHKQHKTGLHYHEATSDGRGQSGYKIIDPTPDNIINPRPSELDAFIDVRTPKGELATCNLISPEMCFKEKTTSTVIKSTLYKVHRHDAPHLMAAFNDSQNHGEWAIYCVEKEASLSFQVGTPFASGLFKSEEYKEFTRTEHDMRGFSFINQSYIDYKLKKHVNTPSEENWKNAKPVGKAIEYNPEDSCFNE